MNIHMLEKYWDTEKTMRNPHKGWYLHFFDNGLSKYGQELHENDDLTDFPALDHIYLRLAWSYLEPQEGKFNWEVIDSIIDRWRARGLTVAFRITCKETSKDQRYATPHWVREAGAAGTDYPSEDGETTWEPDYGDVVFLKKLEAFHRAFAKRYDGQPWVEYIDIGSYGDWGEGHTAASSNKDWPLEVILEHINLHCRCYQRSLLCISDDIVGSRKVQDGSREQIMNHIQSKGITLRDDGISVQFFEEHFGESTLRNPEFFEEFWRNKPIVLELEHYQTTVNSATWKGGLPLVRAAEETHATWAGFHGYPREWLEENREYASILGNRLGYWYFPKSVSYTEEWRRGEKEMVRIVWQNNGLAPAYHRYDVKLKLELEENPEIKLIIWTQESDTTRWMPGCIISETYGIEVSRSLSAGNYRLGVKLVSIENGVERPVELGLKDEQRDMDGFYNICSINVV